MENLKIILIGNSGVGKTTIKKVFFEQERPFELIQNTLEPTRGEEVSFYSLGKTIAVHDLAGQQIDFWLLNPEDVFIDSDLIILILDCRENWNENLMKINEITKIRDNICKKSYIIVFFHKIDLLSSDKISNLKKKIDLHNFKESNLEIILSSISKEYFLEIFNSISRILRNLLFKYNPISEGIITKSEILNIFSKNKDLSITDITNRFKDTNNNLGDILKELGEKKIITFDNSLGKYQLTKKGEELNKKVEYIIETQIQTNFEKEQHIKALIIAEKNGTILYIYSNKENYFLGKLPESGNNVNITTSLITMFFTAFKGFSQSLDDSGVSHIVVEGKAGNILMNSKNEIMAIYFIENLKISKSIESLLQDLTNEFYQMNKPSIEIFSKSGFIHNDLISNKKAIVDMIFKFDHEMELVNNLTSSENIDNLTNLFNQLILEDFDTIDLKMLKNIVFKYILDKNLF